MRVQHPVAPLPARLGRVRTLAGSMDARGKGVGDTRFGLPRGLAPRGLGEEGLGSGVREGARASGALHARAAVGANTRRGLSGRLSSSKREEAGREGSGREKRGEERVGACSHRLGDTPRRYHRHAAAFSSPHSTRMPQRIRRMNRPAQFTVGFSPQQAVHYL